MKRPSLLTLARVWAVMWIVPTVARSGRSVRDRSGSLSAAPDGREPDDLTVVVPARDEADRIGGLLDALGNRHRIVVVDDGSTDTTADVARRRGADVVPAGPRPAGWAGKTWALRRGAEEASGSWIVHLDADVLPNVELPGAAVAFARGRDLDLLSVATRAIAPPTARWLHASMLATLVYRFGGPGSTTEGRELANGQVLVARRSLLVGPDGWASVADHVTEDVALARRLASRGRRVAMVEGFDVAEVDVPTVGAVWHGWGRSIGLPGVEPVWRSIVDLTALVLVMPVPLLRLVCRRADLLDAVSIAARCGTAAGLRRAYRGGGLPVLLSPLADLAALVAVARSAVRRQVIWRGRRLPVPGRTMPSRSAGRRTS